MSVCNETTHYCREPLNCRASLRLPDRCRRPRKCSMQPSGANLRLHDLYRLGVGHHDWWFYACAASTEPLLRPNAKGNEDVTELYDAVATVRRGLMSLAPWLPTIRSPDGQEALDGAVRAISSTTLRRPFQGAQGSSSPRLQSRESEPVRGMVRGHRHRSLPAQSNDLGFCLRNLTASKVGRRIERASFLPTRLGAAWSRASGSARSEPSRRNT